jgi:hypothetical protein
VCPCGLWRPPLQIFCQFGLLTRTPITPERTPLSGIGGPSVVVENRDSDAFASMCEEETVACQWINWNCDISYSDNPLQRYQAGYTVVLPEQQLQQVPNRDRLTGPIPRLFLDRVISSQSRPSL